MPRNYGVCELSSSQPNGESARSDELEKHRRNRGLVSTADDPQELHRWGNQTGELGRNGISLGRAARRGHPGFWIFGYIGQNDRVFVSDHDRLRRARNGFRDVIELGDPVMFIDQVHFGRSQYRDESYPCH